MLTMNHYKLLLEAELTDEAFVSRALALMESELRQLALLALSDWSQTEVVAPELFESVAGLQRPSWGNWNGLLHAIKKGRRNALRAGDPEVHQRINSAATLVRTFEFLDSRVDHDTIESLRPFIALTHFSVGKRPNMQQLLTMPILLRNRIAHDRPTSADYWQQARLALRPLINLLAEQKQLAAIFESAEFAMPWFIQKEQETHAFNGMTANFAVTYVSSDGEAQFSEEHSDAVLNQFQQLLGKIATQEKDFRKWLGKLAPEEVKGVLLGDYLVGKKVGEGGFAAVHQGIQLSTGQKVAIKILRDGMPEDSRLRFQQEAAFLSRFSHPNIVAVYGYGEDVWTAPRNISLDDEEWYQEFANSAQRKTYIALEWVEGKTLHDYFKPDDEKPTDIQTLTAWFIASADALAAVHSNGLIHRDVKPANIMVTDQGVIKLMDFGIARTQDDDRTLMTMTGHEVGTPAYMAPEQILAQDAESEVGAAADIYGLCATFYELFTGNRLYKYSAETAQAVRTMKLEGHKPEAPSILLKGLPWELDVILLGGLEREISDRIQSMDALKTDLNHFLNDEPIEYQRPGLMRRMQLGYKRNRAVLNTVATALLIITVGTIVSFYNINAQKEIAVQEKHEAELQRGLAEKHHIEANHNLGLIYNGKAVKALKEHNIIEARLFSLHALAKLNLGARDRIISEVRGRIISNPITKLVGILNLRSSKVASLSFSPNSKILASGSDDNSTRLWDVVTGQELSVLLGHINPVISVSFSPDGKTLATGSLDKTVRLWDVATGKELFVLKGHSNEVTGVSFSPDGKVLASGSSDKTIRLWDVTSGKELATLKGHAEAVMSVSFSPDGKVLASGSDDHTVRLWDVASGTELSVWNGHANNVNSVSFSPDGKTLASGSSDYTIRLWDVTTGKELFVLNVYKEFVNSVSFSPDGNVLASGSDNTIRLWDVSTGKELFILKGHKDDVFSVSFSPDGKTLATGSFDSTIRLWDVTASKNLPVFQAHKYNGTNVLISPSGNTLASGSRDYTVRLWNVPTGKELAVLEGHKGSVFSISFSPDGKTLASGSSDKTIRLWNVTSGKELRVLKGHTNEVTGVSFSSHGKILASSSRDHTVRLWNVLTGKELFTLKGHKGAVFSVSFSPNGKRLASGSSDKTIRLWDVTTGKELFVLNGHTNAVRGVFFSPDGKTLATRSSGKEIRLWSVTSGKEISVLQGHTDKVNTLSFSLGGNMLASGSSDNSIRLWNVLTGKELFTLKGHKGAIFSVSFSPDGKRLASGSYDKTVRLWDVERGKELAVLKGHKDAVFSVSFSPDDKVLVSGSYDKTIHFWGVENMSKQWAVQRALDMEAQYHLKLDILDLKPIPQEPNLYGVKLKPPTWSESHPFHWQLAAEKGDANAMVQLGLIYDRDNENDKALSWYQKAADAGNAYGKERLMFLTNWMANHHAGKAVQVQVH